MRFLPRPHIVLNRAAWLTMAVLLSLTGAYFLLLARKQGTVAQKAIVTGFSHFTSATVQTASAAAQPTGRPTVPAVCTPVAFGTPSQINLDSVANGLSTQTDTPIRYRIYGNTAAELRAQIRRCGPSAGSSADTEFTGQTDYNLDWQYSTLHDNGECSVTGVKVGLHIATALPYWQPTADATAGLPQRWQQFDTSLLTHEQGHVAIDKTYAAKLATDLNNLGDMLCSQVASSVNSIVSADAAFLDQANDSYDNTTGHGASQGAILPVN